MGWLEGAAGARAALTAGRAALAHLPDLRREHAIVLFMARLALAAGQPQRAARWLDAALERRPAGSWR
jgi:predicted Zn-dependent protease